MKKFLSNILVLSIFLSQTVIPVYANINYQQFSNSMHYNYNLEYQSDEKLIYSYDNDYLGSRDIMEFDYTNNIGKIKHSSGEIDIVTFEKNPENEYVTNILLNGEIVGQIEKSVGTTRGMGEWTYKNTSVQAEAIKKGILGAIVGSLFGPIGWGTVLGAVTGLIISNSGDLSKYTNYYLTFGAKSTIISVDSHKITTFEERICYTYKDAGRTNLIDKTYDSFTKVKDHYH